MAKFPSEEQERFIVLMPEGMRDQLKHEADRNKRSMNAEIVWRLSQSFSALPFQIGREFQQAIAKANPQKLEEIQDDIADILNHHFPNAGIEITPEEHWEKSLEDLRDVPDAYKPMLMEQILKVCRLLAKNPDWMPPADSK